MSRVLKRSTVVSGHKTSISLEDEFWERLKVIAAERGIEPGGMMWVLSASGRAALEGSP